MGSASTDYYECDFPDWALCYLVNDDPSALSDEDKAEADAFLDGLVRKGYRTAYPEVTEDKNEFCPYPAFGKACGTVKVRFRK